MDDIRLPAARPQEGPAIDAPARAVMDAEDIQKILLAPDGGLNACQLTLGQLKILKEKNPDNKWGYLGLEELENAAAYRARGEGASYDSASDDSYRFNIARLPPMPEYVGDAADYGIENVYFDEFVLDPDSCLRIRQILIECAELSGNNGRVLPSITETINVDRLSEIINQTGKADNKLRALQRLGKLYQEATLEGNRYRASVIKVVLTVYLNKAGISDDGKPSPADTLLSEFRDKLKAEMESSASEVMDSSQTDGLFAYGRQVAQIATKLQSTGSVSNAEGSEPEELDTLSQIKTIVDAAVPMGKNEAALKLWYDTLPAPQRVQDNPPPLPAPLKGHENEVVNYFQQQRLHFLQQEIKLAGPRFQEKAKAVAKAEINLKKAIDNLTTVRNDTSKKAEEKRIAKEKVSTAEKKLLQVLQDSKSYYRTVIDATNQYATISENSLIKAKSDKDSIDNLRALFDKKKKEQREIFKLFDIEVGSDASNKESVSLDEFTLAVEGGDDPKLKRATSNAQVVSLRSAAEIKEAIDSGLGIASNRKQREEALEGRLRRQIYTKGRRGALSEHQKQNSDAIERRYVDQIIQEAINRLAVGNMVDDELAASKAAGNEERAHYLNQVRAVINAILISQSGEKNEFHEYRMALLQGGVGAEGYRGAHDVWSRIKEGIKFAAAGGDSKEFKSTQDAILLLANKGGGWRFELRGQLDRYRSALLNPHSTKADKHQIEREIFYNLMDPAHKPFLEGDTWSEGERSLLQSEIADASADFNRNVRFGVARAAINDPRIRKLVDVGSAKMAEDPSGPHLEYKNKASIAASERHPEVSGEATAIDALKKMAQKNPDFVKNLFLWIHQKPEKMIDEEVPEGWASWALGLKGTVQYWMKRGSELGEDALKSLVGTEKYKLVSEYAKALIYENRIEDAAIFDQINGLEVDGKFSAALIELIIQAKKEAADGNGFFISHLSALLDEAGTLKDILDPIKGAVNAVAGKEVYSLEDIADKGRSAQILVEQLKARTFSLKARQEALLSKRGANFTTAGKPEYNAAQAILLAARTLNETAGETSSDAKAAIASGLQNASKFDSELHMRLVTLNAMEESSPGRERFIRELYSYINSSPLALATLIQTLPEDEAQRNMGGKFFPNLNLILAEMDSHPTGLLVTSLVEIFIGMPVILSDDSDSDAKKIPLEKFLSAQIAISKFLSEQTEWKLVDLVSNLKIDNVRSKEMRQQFAEMEGVLDGARRLRDLFHSNQATFEDTGAILTKDDLIALRAANFPESARNKYLVAAEMEKQLEATRLGIASLIEKTGGGWFNRGSSALDDVVHELNVAGLKEDPEVQEAAGALATIVENYKLELSSAEKQVRELRNLAKRQKLELEANQLTLEKRRTSRLLRKYRERLKAVEDVLSTKTSEGLRTKYLSDIFHWDENPTAPSKGKKKQIADAQAELIEIRQKYDENNPDAQQKISDIELKIVELQAEYLGVSRNISVSLASEPELRGELSRIKRKLNEEVAQLQKKQAVRDEFFKRILKSMNEMTLLEEYLPEEDWRQYMARNFYDTAGKAMKELFGGNADGSKAWQATAQNLFAGSDYIGRANLADLQRDYQLANQGFTMQEAYGCLFELLGSPGKLGKAALTFLDWKSVLGWVREHPEFSQDLLQDLALTRNILNGEPAISQIFNVASFNRDNMSVTRTRGSTDLDEAEIENGAVFAIMHLVKVLPLIAGGYKGASEGTIIGNFFKAIPFVSEGISAGIGVASAAAKKIGIGLVPEEADIIVPIYSSTLNGRSREGIETALATIWWRQITRVTSDAIYNASAWVCRETDSTFLRVIGSPILAVANLTFGTLGRMGLGLVAYMASKKWYGFHPSYFVEHFSRLVVEGLPWLGFVALLGTKGIAAVFLLGHPIGWAALLGGYLLYQGVFVKLGLNSIAFRESSERTTAWMTNYGWHGKTKTGQAYTKFLREEVAKAFPSGSGSKL